MSVIDDYKTFAHQLRVAIAKSIRAHMKAKHMNIATIARETGLSYSTLSKRLRAKTSFNVDELAAIAAAMDMTVSDLLFTVPGGEQA